MLPGTLNKWTCFLRTRSSCAVQSSSGGQFSFIFFFSSFFFFFGGLFSEHARACVCECVYFFFFFKWGGSVSRHLTWKGVGGPGVVPHLPTSHWM